MAKKKMYIGEMIIIEVAVFVALSLVGVGLCIWFSSAARPAIRTIRDAVAWTKQFAMFFYSGCAFSLIYSVIATILAGVARLNKRRHWVINAIVTTLAAIALAVIFFLITPSRNSICWVTAAVAILLQGPIIFIPASCAQPGDWGGYCPFVG